MYLGFNTVVEAQIILGAGSETNDSNGSNDTNGTSFGYNVRTVGYWIWVILLGIIVIV